MLCTPEQFKGRIGYFIFVDRFCRGNESPLNPVEGRILKDWEDSVPNWWPNEKGEYPNNYFYGGDLQGITRRLSYLKMLFGVDLLYISPISKTPSSHHYDVIKHIVLKCLYAKIWCLIIWEHTVKSFRKHLIIQIPTITTGLSGGKMENQFFGMVLKKCLSAIS